LTLRLRKKKLELSDCKQLIKDMDAVSEASEMNDIFEKHHSLLEQVTSTSQRKTDTQTGEPLLHMGVWGTITSHGRPTTLPQLPMAGLIEIDHDVSLTPSDVGSYVNVPAYSGRYNMCAGITPSGVNAKPPNRVLTDSNDYVKSNYVNHNYANIPTSSSMLPPPPPGFHPSTSFYLPMIWMGGKN